jgi:23S rRNA G2069 N7-methylase RlmK/C1962 C5-methylase RlmI
LTDTEQKTEEQAIMFRNRLTKRAKHLRKWARRTGVGAYRVYDRDIPEVPLRVDFYSDGDERAATLSLYKRPYEKDAAEEAVWFSRMRQAVCEALDVADTRVFGRVRERAAGGGQYRPTARPTQAFTMRVAENGYLVTVNLSDYIDTGLFFDMRQVRARVKAESAGQRVLNLFCYTGAFSLAAAAGGAIRVDSVDISNTYLDRARENCAESTTCRFIREDVFRFLHTAAERRLLYDTIILNPPNFSASKKMTGTLDVQRDAAALLAGAFALLGTGGVVYFSVVARGFRMPELPPSVVCEDITEAMRDEDFRGHRMPLVFALRRVTPAR